MVIDILSNLKIMLLILFVGVGRELQDLGVEEEALEAWHRMQQGFIFQLRSIFN